MTGEQMCETIAWVYREADVADVTPESIWNQSPTGELWPVYEAFEVACAWLAQKFGPVLTRAKGV